MPAWRREHVWGGRPMRVCRSTSSEPPMHSLWRLDARPWHVQTHLKGTGACPATPHPRRVSRPALWGGSVGSGTVRTPASPSERLAFRAQALAGRRKRSLSPRYTSLARAVTSLAALPPHPPSTLYARERSVRSAPAASAAMRE
eukprot:scaffold3906_cov120-Isochrysis_galbana.AAC.7